MTIQRIGTTEGVKELYGVKVILTAHVWLADWRDFEDHNSVWNEWVDRQNLPVRVCVQTPLWRPNILVEITVTAAQ
jgi:enamine deaminase RidA (YjgF/YER057c/UK114 family)